LLTPNIQQFFILLPKINDMKKIITQAVFFVFVMVTPHALWAQVTVTGSVADQFNNPLIGASVTVKGTSITSQTDVNGKFSIKAPGNNSKLVVSYVGFVSQTISIGTGELVIKMQEDVTKLSEVVVTGLATSVKRTNAANSVASISAKQLSGATRAQTLDGAMQGKIPGVQITANGGAPGGGFFVRLRGVSSITQSAEPLYIVDGVYVNNSQFNTGAGTGPFSGAARQTVGTQDQAPNRLADLNPQDIENIEILKGPSAAAIYGTRANAGVVIITTKKGKAGKASVSFGQDLGFAKALKLIGMHKTPWDTDKIANGIWLTTNANMLALFNANGAGSKTNDYEKLVYGNTGFLRNTRLSITGGTDKIRYFVGGNLQDEKGIQKRTGYNKSSVRLNLDLKPFSFIDISVGTNYINSTSDRSFSGNDNNGVSLGYNLAYLPNWLDQIPQNGVYPANPLTGQNPLEIVDKGVNNEQVNRFITSFNATVHLLRKDNHKLKFTLGGGADYLTSQNEVYMPDDVQYQQAKFTGNPPGASRYSTNNNLNTNLQGFLVYNAQYKAFSFTTSAGFTQLRSNTRINWFQGEGFKPGQRNPSTATVQLSFENFAGEKEIGRVIQQEINWDDKVILTAGVRQDRSSLNGDPKKYYTFPKGSAAVNIANFDFWKVPFINVFKVRGAYGQTGKSAAFSTTFSTLVDIIVAGQPGAGYPNILGNTAIEPERAKEFEAGIDLGLFNGRLGLEFTWYNKKVIDLIESFNLSPGTGVAQIAAFPVGDLQNKGIEIGINGTILSKKNIKWTSNLSWWKNESEMTRLIIPEKNIAATGFAVFGVQRLRQGSSPTAWYGSPNVNGAPTLYEDAQPKWQASWAHTINFFKDFEFTVLIHRSHKNFNSSINQELTDEGGTTPDWSSKNKDGIYVGVARQLGQPGVTSRQFIVDASYTKIREVSLYYTVPKSIFSNKIASKFESLRVGVSANNVALWTPYYGYDPEAANFGNRPTGATVDLLSFPSTRRLFFHFNVTF
jgi:TonB-linked SusC/RagA family outer membrane protein